MGREVVDLTDKESIFRRAFNKNCEELYSGAGSEFAVVSDASASRTLTKSDARKYLRFTSGSAVTVTVAPQSSIDWQGNVEIVIEQAGAGQVTIAAGSGVTLRTSSTAKTNAQYAAVTLKRVAIDEWVIGGERSAS